jgi:hypothetical protein
MIVRPSAPSAGYLSLTTAGFGESVPILVGSNPVGDALLSTGLMSLAGQTTASIAPLLPVQVCGLDVRETLHRLDADARLPSSESGVTSVNRIGERIATLTLRWLLAPDGYEATPSLAPPATELDPSQSQRFVMDGGVLRFEDRTRSGLRFFGAGRTYPSSVDGVSRLLFAGAAVVVDGLGSLKGLRGSITLTGEISSRSLVSLIVTGRFDDDGPFEAAETLGPILDSGANDEGTTVLTLVGESDGGSGAGIVDEHIRLARVENDLAHASRPRSLFRVGERIGYARGPLRFDPFDRRCAVPLIDGRRELILSDVAGRTVATVVAEALEGTTYRDEHAGHQASRVIAYGQLSAGTGALTGAAGLLTMDIAVRPDGRASSVYTLWLADGRGRFRAPGGPRIAATSVAEARLVSAQDFELVESTALAMLPADLEVLNLAERSLADGGEIHRWFQQRQRTADYAERFVVSPDDGRADEGFCFFDEVAVGGSRLPVMGFAQEAFFDRQKLGNPEAIRAQLREFVLGYLLRVSAAAGTSYQQLYFKLAATGQIGKFVNQERVRVVDLREVGSKYDWIVLKTKGSMDAPCLMIGPGLVTDVEGPGSDGLADYGYGFAFVPNAPARSGMIASRADYVRVGVQTTTFRLTADGEIRVRTLFVVNRPDRIAAVDVEPIGWGLQIADLVTFRMASRVASSMLAMSERLPLNAGRVDPIAAYLWMANAITGGLAEKHLGLSKAVLEKRMLLAQFRQQEELLRRLLQVWRTVPDWTAAHVILGSENLSI